MLDEIEYKGFKERLKAAMEMADVSAQELGDAVGVSKQAVYSWMQTGKISRRRLSQVADELGTSTDYLLGRSTERLPRHKAAEPPATYSVQAKGLSEPSPGVRHLPVLDYVSASDPQQVMHSQKKEGSMSTITVPEDQADDLGPNAFVLIVEDRSMYPDFQPGERIVIDPAAPLEPGCFVVAKLDRDGQAILRRYRDRGMDADGNHLFELSPSNQDYATETVEPTNPGRIIGRVKRHWRRL